MGGIPGDLLVYIIVAAVLVMWLRNVLGTRHGDEKSRPNPYLKDNNTSKSVTQDPIEGQSMRIDDSLSADLDSLSFENDEAKDGILKILKKDKSFHPSDFIEKAKDAFVIVVEAFAEGDKDTLSELLAPSVYKSFSKAIDARDKSGETVETEIHAVQKMDIVEAGLKGNVTFVTFRIYAEETAVIKDKNGKIISGDSDRITEMVDLWTFGRDTKSKDPTWQVFETKDGDPEPHKTPVPDAS